VSLGTFSVVALVLAFFTSGHMTVSDALGIRMPLQILLFLIIALSIFTLSKKPITSTGYYLLGAIVCSILGEVAIRGDLYETAGFTLTLCLSFIALTMSRARLIQTIDFFINMNVIFAVMAIFGFFIAFNDVEILVTMMERPELYSNETLNSRNIYKLLGNIDTKNPFFGFIIPRMNGPVQQASLLPAYFLFPLGIALAYSKVSKFKLFMILTFILMALSGNVYVGLLSALLVFIFRSIIPKTAFAFFPYLVLFILTSVIFAFFFNELVSPDLVKGNLRELGILDSGTAEDTNVTMHRISSGSVRLLFLANQFSGILQSYFLPASEEILSLSLGSGIYRLGLEGGGLALILSAWVYFKLFSFSIEGFQKKTSSLTNQFGYCLIYSMLFQAAVYNDYGFSTYYGFMMFAVIINLSSPDRASSR